MPEYAKPISDGNTACATDSRACMACCELKPGAGTPVSSTERNRLKRVVISVPDDGVTRSIVDSGAMSFVVLLRTYSCPMFSGRDRNAGSACTYTRYRRPKRLKSLT